jgi:hypothetical protein
LVRRAIAAAAVDHDDPIDDIARQRGDDRGDGFSFVEGRNDDDTFPPPLWGRVGRRVVRIGNLRD